MAIRERITSSYLNVYIIYNDLHLKDIDTLFIIPCGEILIVRMMFDNETWEDLMTNVFCIFDSIMYIPPS